MKYPDFAKDIEKVRWVDPRNGKYVPCVGCDKPVFVNDYERWKVYIAHCPECLEMEYRRLGALNERGKE